MSDFGGYAGGFDGGYGTTAAYDRSGSSIFRHGLGDLERAFGEGRQFENAHGAVPDDGAGAGYLFGKSLDRLRADIEGHHVGGVRLAMDLDFCLGSAFHAVRDDGTWWRQKLLLMGFPLLPQ